MISLPCLLPFLTTLCDLHQVRVDKLYIVIPFGQKMSSVTVCYLPIRFIQLTFPLVGTNITTVTFADYTHKDHIRVAASMFENHLNKIQASLKKWRTKLNASICNFYPQKRKPPSNQTT